MPKKVKKAPDRILTPGLPNYERCNNEVTTSRYTAWTFLPVVSVKGSNGWLLLALRRMACVRTIGRCEALKQVVQAKACPFGTVAAALPATESLLPTMAFGRWKSSMGCLLR